MLLSPEELFPKKNAGVTRDRETAYRCAINQWLKDRTPYCIHCDTKYRKGVTCCHEMAVYTNWTLTQQIIAQNIIRREKQNDDFGGMVGHPKDIRVGLSMPTSLYNFLDNYEKMHGRRFMSTKKDLRWFARKYPQFCIIKRI